MNTDKLYAESIAKEYAPKNNSKMNDRSRNSDYERHARLCRMRGRISAWYKPFEKQENIV